jgi:hypothetical protein
VLLRFVLLRIHRSLLLLRHNQLIINAVDAARENLKIYNRTVDAVTEFSNNIAKACTAFSATAAQQQQQ